MNYLNLKKISFLTNYRSPIRSQNAFKSETKAILEYYTSNVIIFAMNTFRKVSNALKGKKPIMIERPKDTVVIYQFPRAYNSPSLSPFALKLETFCRAAKINYQNSFGMKTSSQGLIPFIELNNYVVEDSQKCVEYLSEIYEKDMNSSLTDEQRAVGQAVTKMVEERAYRRSWYVGYGRQSKEDLFEIYCKNMNAINVLIGKKKYIFSDTEPSLVDFSIFGVCSQIKYNDTGVLNMYLKTKCHNIVRHIDNMKEKFWPDWDENIRANKKVKKSN